MCRWLALLSRFPYALYYRFDSAGIISCSATIGRARVYLVRLEGSDVMETELPGELLS
ncbi:MAG: hypothetical protein WEA34_14225 [Gemmatimonadota bacterium]